MPLIITMNTKQKKIECVQLDREAIKKAMQDHLRQRKETTNKCHQGAEA
jgi:hypothetical protein